MHFVVFDAHNLTL